MNTGNIHGSEKDAKEKIKTEKVNKKTLCFLIERKHNKTPNNPHAIETLCATAYSKKPPCPNAICGADNIKAALQRALFKSEISKTKNPEKKAVSQKTTTPNIIRTVDCSPKK